MHGTAWFCALKDRRNTSATAPVSKGVQTAYTALKKTKKQDASENMLGNCLTLAVGCENIGNYRNGLVVNP